MMQERVVAIAADYADALLVARRAKRAILLLLVLLLLGQLGIFATAHFAPDLLRPTAAATQPIANWQHWLQYATTGSLYLAMVFSLFLVFVLFVTIHIMLVGRLIGVGYVTKAFTLAMLVVLLLFPWQTILVTRPTDKTDAVVPGVLYTWREVDERVVNRKIENVPTPELILYWARFAAFPVIAIIMLLVVQIRSGRGLKLALGEEELLPPDAP